jgi:hypothetical protein
MISRPWNFNMFPGPTTQQQMTSPRGHQLGHPPPSQPDWTKGARPAPRSRRSRWRPKTHQRLCVLWGPPDPLAPQSATQSGPDAWISKIRDYLKENILPKDHVSA